MAGGVLFRTERELSQLAAGGGNCGRSESFEAAGSGERAAVWDKPRSGQSRSRIFGVLKTRPAFFATFAIFCG